MNYKKLRDRYETDIQFHQLVDTLMVMIEKCQLSPSEIRQAAMFAAIKFEMTHGPKSVFLQDL